MHAHPRRSTESEQGKAYGEAVLLGEGGVKGRPVEFIDRRNHEADDGNEES